MDAHNIISSPISSRATVLTAGLANPANASSGETRPVSVNVSNTISATRSTRSFSVANTTTATPMIVSVRAIYGVMATVAHSRPGLSHS